MSNNGPKYWESFKSCNNILFQIGIPIKKGGKIKVLSTFKIGSIDFFQFLDQTEIIVEKSKNIK